MKIILTGCRKATEDSILAIQIFDQKKFKKKDQGFLGVINVRIGSVMDLDIGGDGKPARNERVWKIWQPTNE